MKPAIRANSIAYAWGRKDSRQLQGSRTYGILKSVSASGQPPVAAGRSTETLLESGYAHVINLRLRWLAGMYGAKGRSEIPNESEKGDGKIKSERFPFFFLLSFFPRAQKKSSVNP